MRKSFAAVVVWLALSCEATAADLSKLAGGWVAEGVSCAALQNYEDERLIKISLLKFEFYEGDCRVTGSTKSGSRYSVQLTCESEGERHMLNWKAVLANPNKLQVDGGFTYRRCGPAR
ncbi:hypothetical protein NKJ48_14225 [Mesorhizobium sp. M0114]|uniref:hypothetical protein n=1 Tax=unclassified Mesorhizobium TaxID=325217 RepID=UPI003339BFE5